MQHFAHDSTTRSYEAQVVGNPSIEEGIAHFYRHDGGLWVCVGGGGAGSKGGSYGVVGVKKSLATTYSPTIKAVPSALESLTSVFGMGTGVASPR